MRIPIWLLSPTNWPSIEEIALMAEPVGYRVRLRVRLTKALNTEDASRVISLGGREVTIVSQTPDQRLSEALWIIFRGQGFSSEAEAREFGEQLRTITEFAGLCSRLGIDVGLDQPTAWFSEEFARSAGLIQPHERLTPNVHGQRWPGKFGQVDKWKICLRAA